MRHKAVIYGVALACVAGASGQFIYDDSPPDAVVTDSYWTADSGEIKLVGICDVLRPDIQCWNPDRTPNQDLSNKVVEEFKKGLPHQANSAVEIPFFFRKKNRLAVFQVPYDTDKIHHTAHVGGIWAPNNRYLQSITGQTFPFVDPNLEYLAFSEEKSQSTTTFTVKLSRTDFKPTLLPVKRGAEAQIGDKTVSVAAITRTESGSGPSYGSNRANSWSVLLKFSGDSTKSRLQINASAVDENGKGFQGVDAKGRPIKWQVPKKGAPGFISDMSGMSRNPFLFTGGIGPYQPDLGGRIWNTSVDPKYLPNLQITISTPLIVRFKDIPLDPK